MIIYCIEDINGKKYVGSTNQKLNDRLSQHRYDRKRNKYLSSKILDLDNCKIYSLEECEKEESHDRERYWLNHTECVNKNNLNFSNDGYEKTVRKAMRSYRSSWGGEYRTHNNLLLIDPNIFN